MKTPSQQPIQESRLLPKMSFRVLFGITTAGALVAALARTADQGSEVAVALLAGLSFLVVCLVFFVVFFLIARLAAIWYEGNSDAAKGSPFADGQLPPQILPPRDPKS